MAGRAGVPLQWMAIFPTRALLEIKVTARAENEDMNGPMPQVIPMHFRAAGAAPDSVVLIDHGKQLAASGAGVWSRSRRNPICKADPFQQR